MILCAALKIKDKSFPFNEIIIPCIRHGLGYSMLNTLVDNRYGMNDCVEGFVTTDNVFLNRKDAYIHAEKCGQLCLTAIMNKQNNGEDELYSEDLY